MEKFVALSILNVGSAENEALLRGITTAEEEPPFIRSVPDLAEAHIWAGMHQPDVVVIDLYRLHDIADGAHFIERFHKNLACSDIPLLAIVDGNNRGRALLAGVGEVITAPLDSHRCRAQLLNALSAGAHRRLLRYRSQWLDEGLGDPPKDGRSQEQEILFRLLRAGEFCNKDSSMHAERVGKISRRIAEVLGCPESECDLIEVAAHLHDIGKLGIPDSILRKPGPLTKDERKTMETHARLGFDILKNGRSPYLQHGAQMALAHHERFDGKGYPHGARGEEIPLCARIVAVADAYDALSSRQPYKLAWTGEKVLEYLNQQKGKHFDPQCVEAIVPHVQSVMDVQ
jgi:two-component system, response regulator RpfG